MTIFGNDDRVYVDNGLDNAPYVYIKAHYEYATLTGSGALIDGDSVLTAGHVIDDEPSLGDLLSVEVLPGYSGYDETPRWGSYTVGTEDVHTHYTASTPYYGIDDFGIINLGVNLRGMIDPLNLAISADSYDQNDVFTSKGYPGDRGFKLMETEGTADLVLGWRLGFYDDLDAMNGQSGSPVEINGDVVGIFVSHSPTDNTAHRITTNTYNTLMSWSAGEQSASNPSDSGGVWGDYYYAIYEDVRDAGVDPAMHYDTWGWREARDPNPWFNTSVYLAHNADVAAADINPWEHFLTYGQYEGRSGLPWWDAAEYDAVLG
ncbi:hypothetical protein [uncultured Rhodospira sp.]|uniref:trypsin-like serine peptidase n=1 Tax=uncultured Rhodospira sp. TaxID=1936189 RepID=UPI0026206EC4|nr:hypothetical protein [uncultured Rhodospira sp.]